MIETWNVISRLTEPFNLMSSERNGFLERKHEPWNLNFLIGWYSYPKFVRNELIARCIYQVNLVENFLLTHIYIYCNHVTNHIWLLVGHFWTTIVINWTIVNSTLVKLLSYVSIDISFVNNTVSFLGNCSRFINIASAELAATPHPQ